MNSAHLTAAGIHKCEHCVIVSGSKNPTPDREMADKNALLCAMNVFQILGGREKQATVEISKIFKKNKQFWTSVINTCDTYRALYNAKCDLENLKNLEFGN